MSCLTTLVLSQLVTSKPLVTFIQEQSELSRRRIFDLLKAGKISVNQKIVYDLTQAINDSTDTIVVNGTRINRCLKKRYIAFHKPLGMISSMKEPNGTWCLGPSLRKIGPSLIAVGRLDKQTTGLILATNDGHFAQQVAHPKYRLSKTYTVTTKQTIRPSSLAQLQAGLFLEDGPIQCHNVISLKKNQVQLSIFEGRNRIIRRLFEALSLPLIGLHRDYVGPIPLGSLGPGEWRDLNSKELKSLQQALTP